MGTDLEGAVAEVEEAIKDALADHEDWLIDNPDMPDDGPDDTSASVWALRTILDALASITRENERLRLLILGGEDAPGVAASLSFGEIERLHKDAVSRHQDDIDTILAMEAALTSDEEPDEYAPTPRQRALDYAIWATATYKSYREWLERADKAEAERDAMREAGKPFFDLAKTVTTPTPGSPPWWQESQDWTVVFSFAGCAVTLGDLRRAAALVNGEGG